VYADGRAAIAYELSSAYWGCGLAAKAVSVMIAELAERYRVHAVSAVLKRQNRRSLRLLQRLGFSIVSDELHAKYDVDPDELLMWHEVLTHERSAP